DRSIPKPPLRRPIPNHAPRSKPPLPPSEAVASTSFLCQSKASQKNAPTRQIHCKDCLGHFPGPPSRHPLPQPRRPEACALKPHARAGGCTDCSRSAIKDASQKSPPSANQGRPGRRQSSPAARAAHTSVRPSPDPTPPATSTPRPDPALHRPPAAELADTPGHQRSAHPPAPDPATASAYRRPRRQGRRRPTTGATAPAHTHKPRRQRAPAAAALPRAPHAGHPSHLPQQ
ncbi:hypothetical protein BRADI_4g05034v3, partial [Brachypodium distachyon]